MNEEQLALVEAALDTLKCAAKDGPLFDNPTKSMQFFKLRLANLEREEFHVAFLDNAHRLIKASKMFMGTINGASVYPREVVKAALKHNAAAVILAHNHPSGVAEPSIADENITKQIKDILRVVDVRLLDHLVVSNDQSVSLAERGLI